MYSTKNIYRRITSIMLAFVMFFSMLPNFTKAAHQDVVTEIKVSKLGAGGVIEGDADGMKIGAWTTVRVDGKIELPNNQVKAGDTTVVKVTDFMDFAGGLTGFPLKHEGVTFANVTFNEKTRTMTITYNEEVEKKSNVTGEFFFLMRVNHFKYLDATKIPLDFTIGVENNLRVINVGTLDYTGVEVSKPVQFYKNGYSIEDGEAPGERPRTFKYVITINQEMLELKDLVLKDRMEFKPESITRFDIKIGEWQINHRRAYELRQKVPMNVEPQFDEDGQGFTLNLGTIPQGKGVEIVYHVRIPYEPQHEEVFVNKAVLTKEGVLYKTHTERERFLTAGGSIVGYSFIIEINKTNPEGQPLSGAKFEVIRDRSGVKVGEIITDGTGKGKLTGLLLDDYTLKEIEAPTGYKLLENPIHVKVNEFAENKIALKNITNERANIEISGQKTWEDANNQDGKRPASIKVNLLADGTLHETKTVTADNGWRYTFTNLPEFKNGVAVQYTVTEEPVDGYTPTITGHDIKNTHIPEVIAVEGKKFWEDAENQDGKRPESITVNVFDGEKVVDTKVVTENDNWSYRFENLPKYKAGNRIIYSVFEEKVDDYESPTYRGFDIVNKRKPETVVIEAIKKWKDANNQDGKRPEKVTVRLLADGQEIQSKELTENDNWRHSFIDLPKYKVGMVGKKINYEIVEDKVEGYQAPKYDGYIVTNTRIPETVTIEGEKRWEDAENQDGKRPSKITVRLLADDVEIESKEVTKADAWKYRFENLPKYKVGSQGEEVVYKIVEDAVEGYEEPEYDGYNVINRRTPETLVIEGEKKWEDAENQDGKRPSKITVRLLADDVEIESKEVTKADAWKYRFENLPKYKVGSQGVEVVYKIVEDAIEGYEVPEYDGYNIINKRAPETVVIEGEKRWEDAENQDGKRPSKITVRLFADGKEVYIKEVTEADTWKYRFENLPKYKAGKEIEYKIVEDTVEGYEAPVYEGYNIINKRTPETVVIEGEKRWEDAENQDGKRPSKITVRLLADDVEIESKEVTEADAWKYRFENLPKYKAGKEIEYRIVEDAVEGYEIPVYEGYNIINKRVPEKISFEGMKVWEDNNNKEGKRPEKIIVKLYADG
ncbi:MAG: Cna B-type domain-containing protein, partial [Tissierellia bacterium]|nr:Cna B-type domain-containing protein [Tissierellia bacterium]